MAEPTDQSLLLGSFRWDGDALWFEWHDGGFPLPFDHARLAAELLSLTNETIDELMENQDSAELRQVLSQAEYLCACWVTSVPDGALPAPGLIAVMLPTTRHPVDPKRWHTR